MAGHYKAKKSSKNRSVHKTGQWALLCLVFVAGYMSASLYDFSQLMTLISEHWFRGSASPVLAKTTVKPAALPKPKFEFYTLLANEQVAGSASSPSLSEASHAVKAVPVPTATHPVALAPVDSASPVSPFIPPPVLVDKSKPAVLTHNLSYMLQVASFKTMQDAERMRVMLVMKGLDVKIAVANQQGTVWYRVIMGPFSSKLKAQDAQVTFARHEHINGMIRRMDA